MERKTKFRVGVLVALICVLTGLFTAQMFKLQKQAEQDGAVQAARSYTYETTVPAARGSILDRNGKVLVTNRASYNVEISHDVLFTSDEPNESLLRIAKLCKALGVEYVDHLPLSLEKPYEYTLESQSSTWQGYYRLFLADRDWDSDMSSANLMKQLKKSYDIPTDWTEEEVRMVVGLRYELSLRRCTNLSLYTLCEDVSAETLAAIMELDVPGLTVQTTTVREYETKAAAHILGRVALLSPEEWETYKDKEGYAMDAKIGKEGLEQAFEEYLHGMDGTRITTVSQEGEVLNERYAKTPQAGSNVVLTIDIDLQETAEKALEQAILELRANGLGEKKEGMDAEGGALVAIDVKTGDVLACASYPTYDISTFSKDFTKLAADKYAPMVNRALQLTYPPGSVYKMVTAIAAIDEKGIGRHYEIRDKGIYTFYDEYQPKCFFYTNTGGTHGVINMMDALSVSCNYYFYEVGRQMGITAIDKVAKGMGLGEPTGVELPEKVGSRANPETKAKLFADDINQSGWYDADTLMASIGQSENAFSPLQLADYTATLANSGKRYRSTFLKKVVSADYQTLIKQNVPEVLSTYPISSDAMLAVREGMRMAATTGTAATYLKDYDVPVAAKTGTAQHGSEGSDHGSFVCYAPYDDPQIAIAIYVEKGAQGGNLAQAARQVMDAYFDSSAAAPIATEGTVG